MTSAASVQVEHLHNAAPNPDLWGVFRVKSAEGSRLELVGWALGTTVPIKQIEVVSLGSVVASTTPGRERPDVAAEFPDRDASSCGFEIAIEAGGKGKSTLQLRAVLEDGTQAELGEVRVSAPPRRWTDVFRRT